MAKISIAILLLLPLLAVAQSYEAVVLYANDKRMETSIPVAVSDTIITIGTERYIVTNSFHTASALIWRVKRRRRTYVMDLVHGETICRLDIRSEGSSRKITYLIMPK